MYKNPEPLKTASKIENDLKLEVQKKTELEGKINELKTTNNKLRIEIKGTDIDAVFTRTTGQRPKLFSLNNF